MYTYEIIDLINKNNGSLSISQYLDICETSPQIWNVKYNTFNNNFEIICSDKQESIIFNVFKDINK